jgi:molybdopterin-synthase adenylyltransferase
VFSTNIAFLGEERQKLLNNAAIMIAGMGGLGCTVAQNLVRLGIGKLIIVDYDKVALSNLNRQILYTAQDVGQFKVEIASENLRKINEFTEIIPINKKIVDSQCLHKEFPENKFAGIADCLDNYESRFILEELLMPDQFLVHGGVMNDFGQITTIRKKLTKSMKDLYKDVEISTRPIPVIPQTVLTIGSLMSHEIMNNIFGTPQLLNKLLITELTDFSMFKIDLE